jgi:glycine cleavage system aminomethyltransferase T
MDFSMLKKVDLEGPGALALVDSLVTRDLSRVGPGRIVYSALMEDDGKMLDDCTILVSGPDRVRFCANYQAGVEMIRERAKGTGVQIRELTDGVQQLCVQGPASRAFLQKLTEGDLSGAAFPYYTFREGFVVAGIPVFMTRMGYTAELGYELWVERERTLELWDTLLDAGRPLGMRIVGLDPLDLLRIEGGFLLAGVEFDTTVSPYECGLGRLIALDKPSLRGRAALERDLRESRQRLTSVQLSAGGAAATSARLVHGGREVGLVTQAVESPYLAGRTLGLARLEQALVEPGTKLLARVGGELIPAEVLRHPVYDPERRRARAD